MRSPYPEGRCRAAWDRPASALAFLVTDKDAGQSRERAPQASRQQTPPTRQRRPLRYELHQGRDRASNEEKRAAARLLRAQR